MPLGPLLLRYGEDGQQPLLGLRRAGGPVDPPVAVLQEPAGLPESSYPAARSPVRAGSRKPRRFSRDTDERTDGASTPAAPSRRTSADTGTGPGKARP